MARNRNKPTTYKRGKIEITGDDTASKVLMFIDLITARLFVIVLLLIVLFTVPKPSWLPLLLQCLKGISKYLLTLLTVLVPSLILLSG